MHWNHSLRISHLIPGTRPVAYVDELDTSPVNSLIDEEIERLVLVESCNSPAPTDEAYRNQQMDFEIRNQNTTLFYRLWELFRKTNDLDTGLAGVSSRISEDANPTH